MQEPISPPLELNVQSYVDQMAVLLELHIPAEIRPSVDENFERLIAIAQPVVEFELPEEVEPAPTFQP